VTWLLPPGISRKLKRLLLKTQEPAKFFILTRREEVSGSDLNGLRFSQDRGFHWVPIEKCVSGTAAGFTATQHHYVRYLAEGIEIFEKYYDLRVPRDAFEVLFDKAPSDYLHEHDGMWRKPWETTEVPIQGDGARDRNQEWGPISDRKLKLEASRLDHLVKSISTRGYVAHAGEPFAFPVYQLLVDDSDSAIEDYRLKISGSHRLAALVHLGWKEVPLAPNPCPPSEVRLSDVNKWPGVTTGKFSVAAAEHFFQLYFRSQKLQFLEGW